jgi:LysM repeat protein
MIGCSTTVFAEKTNNNPRKIYIEKYKSMAIKEMHRSGIPASITMAQACLESGNGLSTLSIKANNHFGIKCHNWKGPSIRHDDDAKNECFRKYKDPYESYKDHSDFLMRNTRYAFLFNYKKTDYKSWAKGLKKAGYATDPHYPQRLIAIIEEEKLYELDKAEYPSGVDGESLSDIDNFSFSAGKNVFSNNKTMFVVAGDDDTYRKIARQQNLSMWEIYSYNDLPKTAPISPGQKIYIERKRNKAEKGTNFHIVEEGETMYTISQKYAIKLNKLYRKNLMEPGEQITPGDTINLRKKKKESEINTQKFEFDY